MTENQQIWEAISSINETLLQIRKDISTIQKDCSKMSSHINFVDGVYSKVKIPFHFLCTQANRICRNDEKGYDEDDCQLKILDKV